MATSPTDINPVCKETAEHYIWGGKSDGWHLLRNNDLSVIQERMPAGASEERHFHHKAQQFFYILSGQATMEVNGRHLALRAGDGLRIPPGIPHQITNNSGDDLHFLLVSSPPSHSDRQVVTTSNPA